MKDLTEGVSSVRAVLRDAFAITKEQRVPSCSTFSCKKIKVSCRVLLPVIIAMLIFHRLCDADPQ